MLWETSGLILKIQLATASLSFCNKQNLWYQQLWFISQCINFSLKLDILYENDVVMFRYKLTAVTMTTSLVPCHIWRLIDRSRECFSSLSLSPCNWSSWWFKSPNELVHIANFPLHKSQMLYCSVYGNAVAVSTPLTKCSDWLWWG